MARPRAGEGAEVTPLPGRSEEDAALMQRVRASGDRKALETLARHYAPRLKSWLVKRGEDAHAAEDIVQDVLVTVWTKAALFDPERGSFSTWAFRLTRNRWIDERRRHGRVKPTEPEVMSVLADAPVDPADGRLDEMAAAKAIHEELALLPVEQKTMLQMAFFEGLSHSEIAQRTGLALGTVKSRIRAPLQKMRGSLERFRGDGR
ncbi:MAG: sigma-70 family RNA polymerase sigma factor [Parvularculaceae bacterium]